MCSVTMNECVQIELFGNGKKALTVSTSPRIPIFQQGYDSIRAQQ